MGANMTKKIIKKNKYYTMEFTNTYHPYAGFEDFVREVKAGIPSYVPDSAEFQITLSHARDYYDVDLCMKWSWVEEREETDKENVKLVEDLAPIMNLTYGIAVYQEQLMFLVQSMAGFSLAEADLLRR